MSNFQKSEAHTSQDILEYQKNQQVINTENQQKICRICFGQMKNDQVFQICDCKGGNQRVHHQCLQKWIQLLEKQCDIYFNYSCNCEICKAKILLKLNCEIRLVNFKEMIKFFKQDFFQSEVFYSFLICMFFFVVPAYLFLLVADLLHSPQQLIQNLVKIYHSSLICLILMVCLVFVLFHLVKFKYGFKPVFKNTVNNQVHTIAVKQQPKPHNKKIKIIEKTKSFLNV